MYSQRVPKTKKTDSQKNTQIQSRAKEPTQAPLDTILKLHQTIGNQAIGRIIQAKLTIGQPGDKYEQEADSVADTVMRMREPPVVRRQMPEPENEEETVQAKSLAQQIAPLVRRQVEEEPVQANFESGLTQNLQRQEEDKEEIVQPKLLVQRQEEVGEEDKEIDVQTKPTIIQRLCLECEEESSSEDRTAQPAISAAPAPIIQNSSVNQASAKIESNINTMKGGGSSLPHPTRNFFESRFGTDFGQVRIHSDSRAAETAKSINAKAFTVGKDVAFGAGEYSPGTPEGKRLLAHELTHVVQQSNGIMSNENNPNIQQTQKSSLIQLYPKCEDDWCIKITKPQKPPDILVPALKGSYGYDVDGDLSLPYGLASAFEHAGWYLEVVYHKKGDPTKSLKFASVHSVITEGAAVKDSLKKTNKEGRAYLTFAAKLNDTEWIEDTREFSVYQHGFTRDPVKSQIGPNKKIFFGNVVRGDNPRGRTVTETINITFSEGWSASDSIGTTYSQATSKTHGVSVKVGGELGLSKVAKVGSDIGYSYSATDTQSISTAMSNAMGISGSVTISKKMNLSSGEAGAIVPWGRVVAFRIPSIKVDKVGHVTGKGSFVVMGYQIDTLSTIVVKINRGEAPSSYYGRLEDKIKKFKPF